jgi:tripartite-type tricarboxylate transporter receptor subunit TctC
MKSENERPSTEVDEATLVKPILILAAVEKTLAEEAIKMKIPRAKIRVGMLLSALFALFACVAGARADDAYPSKAVRVIVPFAPGGGADVIGRLVFSKVSQQMHQAFIIDNRPSAGGLVGAEAVAKAPPDGYTLLLGQTGPNAINPALFKKMPYDPIRGFEPVIQLTRYPYVIVVNPKTRVHTLNELIEQSKQKPGSFTFGTAGMGSSGQLAAELLMRTAGIKMTHVPYKGELYTLLPNQN